MINKQSQWDYFASNRQEMVPFLPEEYSKILEIGCGAGNFRQCFNKPCEYWGVEPFEEAAKAAETKLDNVLVGFYDKVENQIPDNYFDLVVANDVIEHIENPWDLLQSLRKKMTENASLTLSIPNVRFYPNLKNLLVDKDWKYRSAGILDITHLRFFTKKSIIRLLEENGFGIKKIQGIYPHKSGSLRYLIYRMLYGQDLTFLNFAIECKKIS